MSDSGNDIVMYSTQWCPACWRAKQVMKSMKIAFREIDIAHDAAAAELVMEMNQGYRSVPTILFPDGTHLTEPRTDVLKEKLIAYL